MAATHDRPAPGRNGAAAGPHADEAAAPEETPGLEALIAEAEALGALAQQAATRLGGLAAGLRQHRRQSRAVQAAMSSLRQLRLGG